MLALVATLAAGCAAGGATGKTTSKTGTTGAQTVYAGAAGLKVYKEASNTSKVVGQLSLHQKVVRSRVTGGYGYIKTADGKLKGWVVNTRLLRRLPSKTAGGTAKSPDAARQEQAGPAAADVEETPGEAAAPGEAEPSIDESASPGDSAASELPAQAETAPAPQPEAPAPTPTKAPPAPKQQPASKPATGVAPSIFDPY